MGPNGVEPRLADAPGRPTPFGGQMSPNFATRILTQHRVQTRWAPGERPKHGSADLPGRTTWGRARSSPALACAKKHTSTTSWPWNPSRFDPRHEEVDTWMTHGLEGPPFDLNILNCGQTHDYTHPGPTWKRLAMFGGERGRGQVGRPPTEPVRAQPP